MLCGGISANNGYFYGKGDSLESKIGFTFSGAFIGSALVSLGALGAFSVYDPSTLGVAPVVFPLNTVLGVAEATIGYAVGYVSGYLSKPKSTPTPS